MLTPLLHGLIALLVMIQVGVLPIVAQAAVDLGEYRTATYGSPTHYCDPTLSIASPSGSGTLLDPWNMTRCATQPVAGNVVGILPGQSVALTAPGSRLTPAFRPTNGGSWNGTTCTSRIVYVTRYPAIALDYDTITSNANRTELRHAGTDDAADVEGTGGATYGTNGVNCITFDGLFVDMAQNGFHIDSGIIGIWDSNGITVKNFVIKGKTTDADSNAAILRTENVVSVLFENYTIRDARNAPTGGGLNQRGETSIQYGSRDVQHRHFYLKNVDRGLFQKGTTTGPQYNYGTIEYGIVENASVCFSFNDLHDTQLTYVRYNLCRTVPTTAALSASAFMFDSISTAGRNITIDHNTFAKIDASDINGTGNMIVKTTALGLGPSASNAVTITNNAFDNDNGSYGHMVQLGTTLPQTMNYNCYTKNGATPSYVFNSSQYNTFASWQAAISSRDANSQEVASIGFADRTNNNFDITSGACLTASSTGGEVGAYATSEVIGPDTTDSGGGSSGGARFGLFNLRR